ncbi:unnamed protein product [Nesidiocoris tenuis]|uniref:Uncharacterized protein n=1 Tax=Nesidiocoris tenuis TaxID=355587 RepID=A0A6H5GPG7_9HEMI|nr:unnamed protein product [Nesidiocoris tenuis]
MFDRCRFRIGQNRNDSVRKFAYQNMEVLCVIYAPPVSFNIRVLHLAIQQFRASKGKFSERIHLLINSTGSVHCALPILSYHSALISVIQIHGYEYDKNTDDY